MVASPTFGLPERLGGDRNWDYRYTWIRDTSFALSAAQRLGTTHANAFMDWVETRCGELGPDGSLQVVYGIDGRHELIGGSRADHFAAREWCSLFHHELVFSVRPAEACPETAFAG